MLDETETLDDVFAFLSAFDLPVVEDAAADRQLSVESNSSSPAAEDPTRESSPASSQDAKRPKRSKRTSQKQRIESLRETIRELNAELQSLLPPWQPDFVPAGHEQLVPQRKSMWKEIAARQLERRQKAEEENAKLREMAKTQVQEARNLRRVLKRRAKIEMLEDMLGVKKHKALEAGAPEDNPQVFEDMLQDVDELYVGVDSLFAAKGLYRLPCPGRQRVSPRRHQRLVPRVHAAPHAAVRPSDDRESRVEGHAPDRLPRFD